MQQKVTKKFKGEKDFDFYFQNIAFPMQEEQLSFLHAKRNRSMTNKDAYYVQRMSENQIEELDLGHILKAKKKNIESIYGFDGLYNLFFKGQPSVKLVARVLRSLIYRNHQNLMFANSKQYYVLGQDGVYSKFENKPEFVLFLKDKFWQMNIFGLILEQKNIEKKDYSFYPTELKEYCSKKFILEIADYFVTSVGTIAQQDFKKILEWQEGKILYNDVVVNLKTGATDFLEGYPELQGLCKTGIDFPNFDAAKIKFLIKQVIVTYGRPNCNRFLYFLLMCLQGTLKQKKLIGVSSGPRHSGSTALQDSLKNGLGSYVSTKNGESVLFQQSNKVPESARQYAMFRNLFALLYIVTDYPSLPVDSDNLKRLTGGESFDARSLYHEDAEMPYFLASMLFVGNPILNVVEKDIQNTFVTFRRARIMLPSQERKNELLDLGFEKSRLRLENSSTAAQLKNPEMASHWIHVFQILKNHKTVLGKKIFNNSQKEVSKKKKKFPALQKKKRDSRYWSLLDLNTQLAYIIHSHFCITRHPEDIAQLSTLNEIWGTYSFARSKPGMENKGKPTLDQWKKYLKENKNFQEFTHGPKTPNIGKESHTGPTIAQKTFTRLELKSQTTGETQKVHCIRGLRLRNRKNGFEDIDFHSEDFPLEEQKEYKKQKKAYLQKRKQAIKNFSNKYCYHYVPAVLAQPSNLVDSAQAVLLKPLDLVDPPKEDSPVPLPKKAKIETAIESPVL